MIVELKSLLPLFDGTVQESEKKPETLSFSIPGEERHFSPLAAIFPEMSPALPEDRKLSADFYAAPPRPDGENPPADQNNSHITALLEQLIAVSEKNAESSDRITELLEQQQSDAPLLFN